MLPYVSLKAAYRPILTTSIGSIHKGHKGMGGHSMGTPRNGLPVGIGVLEAGLGDPLNAGAVAPPLPELPAEHLAVRVAEAAVAGELTAVRHPLLVEDVLVQEVRRMGPPQRPDGS